MDVIEWQQSFSIGIDDVDQQHQKLVAVTNQFGKQLSQDDVNQDQLENIFSELVSYTQYHFESEESLMATAAIDSRHIQHHKSEHENFLQEVSNFHQEVLAGHCSARQLFDFLMNWLVYHILGTDHELGRQFTAIKSGASPEKAYLLSKRNTDQATGLLLHSLNNLFSQVVQRNSQLRDLNQSLEAKVDARTRELLEANSQLEILATTDALTGLANRRRAMGLLANLWHNADRKNKQLSIMLIDADGFKRINDSYGHDAGDAVLCGLARHLSHSVRTDDLVCRLGGDEFLIICPETGAEGVQHIAQELHSKVAELKLDAGEGVWNGSISVGVATRNAAMHNPEDLLKAADMAVYAAKGAGKNCVRTA